MKRITTTHSRNYLAMTVVAAIAAMFIVPAGLASADHELTDDTILSKSIVVCTTEIVVKQTTSTACSFSISYNNPGVPAIIQATVPAEWEVTNADDIVAANCSVDPAIFFSTPWYWWASPPFLRHPQPFMGFTCWRPWCWEGFSWRWPGC